MVSELATRVQENDSEEALVKEEPSMNDVTDSQQAVNAAPATEETPTGNPHAEAQESTPGM